ncbi:MAG: VTT domain-containing protein [Candidatus Pacebacteria bacterium]|nr:VTT domain-containing protein [Candidatus Paceibacterota bacterium]
MIEHLITSIQVFALSWGAWGVFGLAFLQEIIPPIPSTLVTVASGFLFLEHAPITGASILKLFLMVGLPIAGGLTIGAMIVYGVVYAGGRPLVRRYGHLIGTSEEDIERLHTRMKGTTNDEAILFALRAFPLTPSILLNVFAGIVRWNPVSFVISTFFGTIIRAMWSGFIGWQLGAVYVHYADFIEQGQTLVLIIAFGAFVWFFYRRRQKMRYNKDIIQP